MKRVILIGLLTALALSGKTFKIQIEQPVQIGKVMVQPGDYKIEVEGDSAVLKTKKGVEVVKAAKLESGSEKFTRTAMAATKDGDKLKVNSIKLEGTTQRALFE